MHCEFHFFLSITDASFLFILSWDQCLSFHSCSTCIFSLTWLWEKILLMIGFRIYCKFKLARKNHAFNSKYNILSSGKISKPLNIEVWAWVENIIMESNKHQISVKSEVHCLAMINTGEATHGYNNESQYHL